jgi:hypothetical protein
MKTKISEPTTPDTQQPSFQTTKSESISYILQLFWLVGWLDVA